MSSACAEWRAQSPTSATAPAQTPADLGVPETQTGWARRIVAYHDARGCEISARRVKNLAAKIAKRAARMQFVDPDDLIRYVLTYRDETGEEAVRRVLASA